MRTNRHRFSRGMVVRILFYGLFLVGPCALTESHALYIRKKQKSVSESCGIVNEKACQESSRKIVLLDTLGVSAIGLWVIWLCFAFGGQIIRVVHERRSMRKREFAMKSLQEALVIKRMCNMTINRLV